MNALVIGNYSRVRVSFLLIPLLLLLSIAFFLYVHHAWNADSYIQIQKNCFYSLNAKLAQYPQTIFNLTQIGDALIVLSLFSIFYVYAPIIWESLVTASLISMLASPALKNIFTVPRPAAVLDTSSFFIIGEKLQGFNSLPSGHSITVFTSFTILLFAFLPKHLLNRIVWIFLILFVGFSLAITRVGVGAHFPLDVLSGSIVGFASGIAGILICRKFPIFSWLVKKKFYPVFIVVMLIFSYLLINKIIIDSLPIYFLTLAALFYSLYQTTYVYFKR